MALSQFCGVLRAASGAVQPGLNAVKRAIPSRLGRPLSPFHPPSHPHGGPARPPLPLLVWTRRALSCLRKPPKQLSSGGRQVPLSPLEWELPCLLNGSLVLNLGDLRASCHGSKCDDPLIRGVPVRRSWLVLTKQLRVDPRIMYLRSLAQRGRAADPYDRKYSPLSRLS